MGDTKFQIKPLIFRAKIFISSNVWNQVKWYTKLKLLLKNSFIVGQAEQNYEFIKVEIAGEKKNVGLVTLNRPKALNALCNKLMTELNNAVNKLDTNDSIGAIVLTGSEKAFAAGKIHFVVIKIIIN